MAGFTDAQLELGATIWFKSSPSKLAPYLVGTWMDAVMLGMVVIMFETWRQNKVEERKLTKALMVYLLLVNLGISGFYLSNVIKLFVTGFGTYKNFLDPHFYRAVHFLHLSSRVPAVLWFAHRAFLVSGRSVLVPLTVGPLLLTTIGCAIGFSFTTLDLARDIRDSNGYILIAAYCSAEVTADVIITTVIFVGLYRSRTGWKTTDTIISRLLIVLAETQLPPTLIAVTFGICFVTIPADTINFYFLGVSKVHVICLMAVVISRQRIASLSTNEESYELPGTKLEVSVEINTQIQACGPDKSLPTRKYSVTEPNGQLRSVNGRLQFGQEGEIEHYKELHSKTSLV